jgi:hypothetical protein
MGKLTNAGEDNPRRVKPRGDKPMMRQTQEKDKRRRRTNLGENKPRGQECDKRMRTNQERKNPA